MLAATLQPHILALTREAWEAALRPMLTERGGFAFGLARWLAMERECRLLVDRITVADQLPSGADFGPLTDWFVLAVAPIAQSAQAMLAQIQPKASQSCAAVIVDPGGEGATAAWDGAIALPDRGVVPLDGFRVVGPEMFSVEREPPSLDAGRVGDLAGRYSRLEGAVGQQVLDRLRRASVTLIGAGRNGSSLAFQLASMGVRTLRLIDGDTLGLENLDAMPGLVAADVGRPKVSALAARLLLLRPDLSVSCFDAPLSAQAMALRRLPTDLIVTAVDSDTPRLAASLLARETLTVHVDVGTSVTRDGSGEMLLAGDVRLLLPRSGCVSCVGGLADRDESLYELDAPPGTLRRGRPLAWHQQRAGSLLTLNSMACGVAVQAWLDLLSGQLQTSLWHRLRWIPGEGIQADAAPVSAAEDCPFCRGTGERA